MDRFFGLDHPVTPDGLVLLRTFYDPVSISIAEEALRDGKILYVEKDRGGGGAMRIIAGFSMCGVDFFVDPSDEERAAELFAALFDSAEAADGEAADEGEDEAGDADEKDEDV